MRRSEEIEAVFRRIWTALIQGDSATHRNFWGSPDLWAIGSDETEWWGGHQDVATIFERQIREIGLVDVTYKKTEPYESGGIGWIAADLELVTTAAGTVPVRITAVFSLDEGMWRVVQWHTSIASPNEEIFGVELTVTLDHLLASLDEETTETVQRAAPEGTATIMFTDIKGSTALSQALGDEAWLEVIRSHFETLRRIVEEEGGTVVKTLGDGAMFAFVSARSALRAAAMVQRTTSSNDAQPPLSVRIGLHAGDVVHEEGDYIGLTVSKAARVTASADGGEIMVSSVVAELAGGGSFEFGAPIQVELKGLAGTHQLLPMLWM